MVAAPAKTSNQGNMLQLMALREIRDDMFCLRAATKQKHQREYMAVVRVEPVNLPLMSGGEQEAILEGFRSFLAGLSPKDRTLSIHCRTARYDLQPYLDKLDEMAAKHESPLYQLMAADHKAFVQKLASQRALLQRDFFVRVPMGSILTCVEIEESGILGWNFIFSSKNQEDTNGSYTEQ